MKLIMKAVKKNAVCRNPQVSEGERSPDTGPRGVRLRGFPGGRDSGGQPPRSLRKYIATLSAGKNAKKKKEYFCRRNIRYSRTNIDYSREP